MVGATGVVGQEMLRLLENSPLGESTPRLLASVRSAGTHIRWRDEDLLVEVLDHDTVLTDLDVALMAAGSETARIWAPQFVKAGVAVVDNSSAYRLDAEVALVVPEVNPEAVPRGPAIIANPNCSTIILLLALKPLMHLTPNRVIADTYQAVSGAGRAGLDALEREVAGGEFRVDDPFPFPIHGNLFPSIGEVDEDGVTVEERKMLDESRKILGDEDLIVQGTCVRVPVARCHSIAVTMLFDREDSKRLDSALAALRQAPGVILEEDPQSPPTPGRLSGVHEVSVGRVRAPSTDALQMWVVGDQVLKGAALNTVQIAELWSAKNG
ncbi:MAG: aspartate-semialdehyde dehydrogenase [Planctomycetota bacterium]|nr:aspartate-semialdehyde dehydrogenase [Planctomycetota bacterium]